MALTSILYRFHINLSDIDKCVYKPLDLRLAMHATTPNSEIRLWIKIGNAGARKLHKAAKAAKQVKVYSVPLSSRCVAKECRSE